MLDKFKIGHFTDETNGTGVTAIICEDGAVGGVSVRGAAPQRAKPTAFARKNRRKGKRGCAVGRQCVRAGSVMRRYAVSCGTGQRL